MTYTPKSYTPSSFVSSNEPEQKKKGEWLKAAGGILGGLTGGILGTGAAPIVGTAAGAGLGAAAGTAGGAVLQDLLYGNANKKASDYTGNTKYGFQELTPQGRTNQAMDVVNATKDAAIAGGATYLGGKTLGLGPKGTGVLNSLGRIGVKTAAGTAIGAGAGFGQGDIQNTPIEDRGHNAQTGAVFGGVLSLLGSGGQEVVKGIKNMNKTEVASKIASNITNLKNKTNVTNDLAEKINTLAASPDAPKINYDLVKSRVESRVMTLSGTQRSAVLNQLDQEPTGSLTLVDALAKKRGLGFTLNTKASTSKFNEFLRQELMKEIHLQSPELAKLDNLYSVIKDVQKPTASMIKKIIAGSIIGGTGVGVFNAFKK